ncbi:hypothetical protein HBH56_065010 [Parastagonospora nodorum]|uniref:Uncharacterized protein n=2 Tax=Phaeosphaeria nodorum (strain SN15 / ATCC MYA-4574 / FGSC 10173) TaxID=321614 RepID=A0A7U2EUS1_PHANO|nr:hypothetical protein SNOG_03475 [Parastagonospora nodorum SN15]KAH3915800.1 hypothetical protein HBH56_065010 [Parastagonospora nodorum]EAT88680.1 hypothetical protein SNOG_03475 [Parastagonospora nodorum SN15]KAH3932667.1 hypothetical protein HBH54_083080 [Parastagonospora nodorum]KAH3955206.1 hypothetical protein HBH53_011310 [Parastagonospora nodorum]KAH3986553.1 hypothetical protein HBH52_042500 [Parastagonospora nodorum]
MSAPIASTGTAQQNAPPAAPTQSNRPNQGRKKTKKNKPATKSGPKLRSADPLSNDPDTTRIQARLASGGTAASLAEEAYRLCRINASLRRELAAAKAVPFTTDNEAARIKARLDDNPTPREMAEEAYRMCRLNAHAKKDKDRVQAELREAKKQMAVKDDALSEMREEYPEMRRILVRAFGLLKARNVDVPEDLSEAYRAVMDAERHVKKNTVRRNAPKAREVVVVKEVRKEEDRKTPFLLHMQNGKVYDLEKPLAEQDSEEEDSESESESEPPVVSRKCKGAEMDMSVAKKARVEGEMEEGEVDEYIAWV